MLRDMLWGLACTACNVRIRMLGSWGAVVCCNGEPETTYITQTLASEKGMLNNYERPKLGKYKVLELDLSKLILAGLAWVVSVFMYIYNLKFS